MLANVVYTGQVSHKGTCFPGEHEAIVELGVWKKAQAHLRHNARTGGKAVRNKHGALLRDILRCDACHCAMVHTWTQKGATRYRYYVCLKAQKQGWASCPTKSVPAKEIEGFVVGKICAIGADPGVVTATVEAAAAQHEAAIEGLAAERAAVEKNLRRLHAVLARLAAAPEQDGAGARLAGLHEELRAAEQRQTELGARVLAAEAARPDAGDLAAALANFDPVWDALFPREQARILRLLVERVGYDGGKEKLAITFRPSGIKALAHEGGGDTNEETR